RVVGDRERRAQIAERERDLVAREAVVEERARIARELHDVIAHHVSMIVLQAGAERRVLDGANVPTRANHSRPSPASPTSRFWSGSSGKPAFPSSSTSKASDASSRSGSSCPPTGSSKRR